VLPLSRRTRSRIDHALEAAPLETRPLLRSRLDALVADCGCLVGAILMAIAALLVIGYATTRTRWSAPHSITFVLVTLLTAAALGKLLGLAVARARLLVMLHQAERRADSGVAHKPR
jgi:hypothetical protein